MELQRSRNAEFYNLFQCYSRKVWRAAYACCGDKHIAEDATQEAFLRLWQRLERGQKIASPLAWLCCVASHLATDQARSKFHRNGTQRPEIINGFASEEPSVLHALERREDAEKVQQGFAALPDDDRALLDMHQHQTIAEIAAEKGWSKSKVKKKLAKARAPLRPLLEN